MYPKTCGCSWFPKAAYMGFKNDFEVPKTAGNIPRFSMLVCGMFCALATSVVYAFSLITDQLTIWGYTTNDITTVSTVGIVIGYLTLPFGFIFDYLGPKPIFALGIILNVLGTCLFAQAFDGNIGRGVAGISVINAILNLGCSLYDMGGVLSTLSWFPLDRGLVIACLKTSTGLGSSVIATIYGTWLEGKQVPYMYFLMALSVVLGLVAIVLVYLPPFHMTGWRESHYSTDDRVKAAKYLSVYMRAKAPIIRFVHALTLLISILIIVWIRSIYFIYVDASQREIEIPSIIMIILYVLLITVVLPFQCLDKQPACYDRANQEADEERMANDPADEPGACTDDLDVDDAYVAPQKTLGPEPELEADEEEETKPKRSCWEATKDAFRDEKQDQLVFEPRNRDECVEALKLASEIDKISPQFPTGFFRNCLRPTLILMWVVGFCVSGCIIVVSLNAGDMYNAIAEEVGENKQRTLYVALISIGSAIGRLTMSFIEVFTQSKPPARRIPITVFYIVAPFLCMVAFVLFLVVPAVGLVAPFILVGIGNGFYAACEVLTARTIFSVDISKHYNSLFFAEMLAIIFMNRLLYGEIMTKNSVTITTAAGPRHVCLGRKPCLQTTFIVMVVLGAVGTVSAIGVFLTYRAFAQKEYKKRAERRDYLEQRLAAFEGRAVEDSNNNADDSTA